MQTEHRVIWETGGSMQTDGTDIACTKLDGRMVDIAPSKQARWVRINADRIPRDYMVGKNRSTASY